MERKVRFQVLEAIVADGATVLPGTYPGATRSITISGFGGAKTQTAPEYMLEVTEEQRAAAAGEAPNPNHVSMTVDVTEHVSSGKVKVL